MSVNKSVEQPKLTDGKLYSKRRFLKLARDTAIVVAGAGIFGLPSLAYAGGKEPPKPAPGGQENKEPVFKKTVWDEIRELLDNAPVTDKSTQNLHNVLVGQINRLEGIFSPRMTRNDELITLTRERTNTGGPSVLIQELHRLFGNGERTEVDLENLLPFFQDKRMIDGYIDTIRQFLRGFDNNIASGWNLENQYQFLTSFIKGVLEYQFRIFGDEVSRDRTGAITIMMDPNIEATDRGREVYKKHTELISRFIDTYPFLVYFSNKIILTSAKYGTRKVPRSSSSSTHSSELNVDENKRFEINEINMDSMWGEFLVEQTFAHEALGHGLDPFVSLDFAQNLTPQEYIETLTHYLQILNNPDWGDRDGQIAQLFRKTPNAQEDLGLVKSGQPLDTNQFVTLISNYQRNYILYNGYCNEIPDNVRFLGIYDSAVPENRTPLTAPEPIDAKLLTKKYLSLDEFLSDYTPVLERRERAEDLKAKIILYGLNHFKEDFGNTHFIWKNYSKNLGFIVPIEGYGVGSSWINYLNVIIANATLYDTALNNPSKMQEWFPNQTVRDNLMRAVINLRRNARRELFAEGIGWSHYLGERVGDNP